MNCPGLLLEGHSGYSPLFLRRMFNGRNVSHILPYHAPFDYTVVPMVAIFESSLYTQN